MSENINEADLPQSVIEHRARLAEWDRLYGKQAAATSGAGTKTNEVIQMSGHTTAAQVVHSFSLAVASAMQRNGGNRQRAIRQVARQQPELHAQYLKAFTGRAGIDRPRYQ